MITFATEKMIPKLILIWKECFPCEKDNESEVHLFFSQVFQEQNTLVWLEKEEPVSMIYMLPTTLVMNDKSVSVRYIYAVATEKAFRGRKLAAKLLEYGKNKIKEPFVLVPATNSLRSYYKNLGFFNSFRVKEITYLFEYLQPIFVCQKKELQIFELKSSRKYMVLRNQYFEKKAKKSGYVKWDQGMITYALLENEMAGGTVYQIIYKDKEFLVLCRIHEDTLFILETTIEEDNMQSILYELSVYTGYRKIKVRVPIYSSLSGNICEFAMMDRNVSLENGYFNLELD